MRHHREPQVRPGLSLPPPSSSRPLVVCARATIVCIYTYVISTLLIPPIQSPRKDGGDAMVWSKPGRRVATHSPPRSASPTTCLWASGFAMCVFMPTSYPCTGRKATYYMHPHCVGLALWLSPSTSSVHRPHSPPLWLRAIATTERRKYSAPEK